MDAWDEWLNFGGIEDDQDDDLRANDADKWQDWLSDYRLDENEDPSTDGNSFFENIISGASKLWSGIDGKGQAAIISGLGSAILGGVQTRAKEKEAEATRLFTKEQLQMSIDQANRVRKEDYGRKVRSFGGTVNEDGVAVMKAGKMYSEADAEKMRQDLWGPFAVTPKSRGLLWIDQ